MFWRQFRATARLRTLFCTSLIEHGILKFSTRLWLFANFEQMDSCAWCLAQVLPSYQNGPILSKTTVSQCDLEPISNNSTVAQAVVPKLYLKQHIKVRWILFTPHTNLGILTVVRSFSRQLQVKQWEYFVRLLFPLSFSQTPPIFLQFVAAHTVLNKNSKFEDVCRFLT